MCSLWRIEKNSNIQGLVSVFIANRSFYIFLGLSGEDKANLVIISLQKLHQTGAKGVAIVFDGPHAHLTMAEVLGAKLNPDNMRPFFPHPSDPNLRVHVLLDIAHMLKLVRNSLASTKIIKSASGEVKWDYIAKLYLLQEKEGLRAGTKLKRPHIEWERNKMKVSYASQTLSQSVANAIDFCREDLKLSEFQGSEATTEFIRVFDSLFDSFNSQNPRGKRFKAPLKSENYHEWISLYGEAVFYIKELHTVDGRPILASRVKTGFLGFLNGIYAFQNLFDDLVTGGPMDYILAYKFSQDHLELFNGSVRSSLGKNNNPTCRQFCSIFKRLLVKLELRDVRGNVTAQDQTSLMTVSSVSRKALSEIQPKDVFSLDREDENLGDGILEDANLVIKLCLLINSGLVHYTESG